MKKIKNWIYKNRSRIFVILAVFMIAINILPTNELIQNNAAYAQITSSSKQVDNGGAMNNILVGISNVGIGVLGAPVATIINVFVLIIFVALYIVFQSLGMAANGLSFPFPDQIVFNKLAFFDPNFINPPTVNGGQLVSNAPVVVMQSIVSDMYYSFFILAGTIFVIAAMVIGIKLAFSTLASQKAQYKEALTNWVMGLILLFTIHIIMAGIFFINEQIVQAASDIADTAELKFTVSKEAAGEVGGAVIGGTVGATGGALGTVIGAGIGKTIGSIVTGLGDITDALTGNESGEEGVDMGFEGYSGYILYIIFNALSGDIVYSIVAAVILGQTISLVITYTKRLFFCIFLGLMAPMIVAVDVIKKSIS